MYCLSVLLYIPWKLNTCPPTLQAQKKKDQASGQKSDVKKGVGPANRTKISKASSFTRIPAKSNGGAEAQHNHSDLVVESEVETNSPATRRSFSGNLLRPNVTVPQPFALATDKRASAGGRLNVGETPVQSRQSHRSVLDSVTKDGLV